MWHENSPCNNLLYDSHISMVTDHRAHAYPWLRDCSSCTCVQISWFKLSGRKLSAMSEIIDSVVSKSILEKAEKGAANVDWFCIPPEKRIVDDSILLWVAGFEEAVSTESLDYEKENSDIENSAKRLKTEASNTDVKKPLAPANRFEGMTTSDQLATFSEGFVPANTKANTSGPSGISRHGLTGESLKIQTIQCRVTFCLVETLLR